MALPKVKIPAKNASLLGFLEIPMREWPNTAQLGDRCSTLFAILGQPPRAEQVVYFAVLALAEMLTVPA